MKVAMSAVLDVVQECWCHVFGVAICSERVRTVDWMDSAILVIGELRVQRCRPNANPNLLFSDTQQQASRKMVERAMESERHVWEMVKVQLSRY